jgi:hypothetical protein
MIARRNAMQRHDRQPRLLPAFLVLVLPALGGPVAAADLDTYTSAGAWLEALPGAPTVEGFDAFDDASTLTTQVPGLSFSSPNAVFEGYLAPRAEGYDYAPSEPNVLNGGSVPGNGDTLQTIVIDCSPPVMGLAFLLGAYHPDATPLSVLFEFADETSAMAEVSNTTEDETANVFFGAVADTAIVRVALVSGTESGGYEEFVLDDLSWLAVADDDTPPVCAGAPVDFEGSLGIAGSATDADDNDSGIATLILEGEPANIELIVGGFEPGAGSVPFTVFQIDSGMDASGTVLATDVAGNECRLPIGFRALPAGPLAGEVLCSGEGILFSVSNEAVTGPGTAACSATLPLPTDPVYPPGYEPSPEDDPFPCRVLTIESPVAGETDMVYKKDGTFDPRLRLLYSRYDGMTFPPFTDATLSVEPILSVVPDPTRLKGKTQWSPVKIACALQSELCNGADDDGDGLVDEGLPVSGPEVDADGDSHPLCPAAGAADCNDQIAAIHPSAAETCNGLDDDCDATIDEGNPGGGADCDLPGLAGACATGDSVCVDGALACTQSVFPSAEVCDGADNDCNGSTDEDYLFSGYLPPVNADGSSIFRRRRAIPLKFRLTDCSGSVVPGAIARLQVYFFASGIVGDEIEEVDSLAASNTGNLFRFDLASGQYIYNLDTRPLAPGNSYLLRTTLDDGTSHDVVVSIQ